MATLTFQQYLNGKVRDISVPDNAILTICADAGVDPEAEYSEGTQRQKDLALAYYYVWLAGPILQTSTVRDSDADWEHSEGGIRLSAKILERYLDMANEIFEQYDLPAVGVETWGFVGRGFSNPNVTRRNLRQ